MPKQRIKKEPGYYKGKTYNQWVNAYNRGEASYEEYLIARRIVVEGLDEDQATKMVQSAEVKEE